jgi:hypothetical protein
MAHETHIFMAVVAILATIGGWFFKRIFKLLDDCAVKMQVIEVEVARVKTDQSSIHHRLDSIDKKLDRLLERER